MKADLLVLNAGQLVTCASPGGPRRGMAMGDVGIAEDGAVAADGWVLGSEKLPNFLP